MTVGANSYGTADGVAVRCGQYVDGITGLFTTTTHPTKAQVEAFINQVSGSMNIALSKAGFTIPVTQADALMAITGVIEEYSADLVLATGNQGRFYQEPFQRTGMNRMAFISKEINEWVIAAADGLEAMGVPRDTEGGASSLQAGVISLDFADHNEQVY